MRSRNHVYAKTSKMDSKEQRSTLRAAVYRGDGPAVVHLLQNAGNYDDALQLAGDGLIAAVIQRAQGAPELARHLGERIPERIAAPPLVVDLGQPVAERLDVPRILALGALRQRHRRQPCDSGRPPPQAQPSQTSRRHLICSREWSRIQPRGPVRSVLVAAAGPRDGD